MAKELKRLLQRGYGRIAFIKDKDIHFPFITFGPGETSQAHQVDEYVQKDVYLTFIQLYQEMFTTYLNDEK